MLKGVLRKSDGFKAILQHGDKPLNEDQLFQLRKKCVFLLRAYEIALRNMGTDNTHWKKDCCQEVVDQMNDIGLDVLINVNTLVNWNSAFRKRQQFPHPNLMWPTTPNQSQHCLTTFCIRLPSQPRDSMQCEEHAAFR
jgi:hypothetical protein